MSESQPPVRLRTVCRLCSMQLPAHGSIDLGGTPLANAYEKTVQPETELFRLYLATCHGCGHVQLPVIVDPKRLFSDYSYVSSTAPSFVAHLHDFASDTAPTKPGFVVEIGSNDGTLLREFKAQGHRVLGVDPAENLARLATDAGLPTRPTFFDRAAAGEIATIYGKADLIAALNVFAHADDLHGIAAGVEHLLADDGVFVFEVGYLPDMIARGLYRVIYHEHLSYHALTPLLSFFQQHGLELFDAHRVPTQGGSIRCFVRHGNIWRGHQPTVRLLELLEEEAQPGTLDVTRLRQRISDDKRRLREALSSWQEQGLEVCGYGAPAQLTTTCYALGVERTDIDFIVDDNQLKQGRFTPGLRIPILNPGALYSREPDVCIIFSANFADEIKARHAAFAGEFWAL